MKEKIIEIISQPISAELKTNEIIILFNEHLLNKFKEQSDNNANNFMQEIWIKM